MGHVKKIMAGLLLLVFAVTAGLLPSEKVQAGSTSTPDFQMKGNTLVKYTGTASVVTVPTYVKNIGEEAFQGHTEIVRINLPAYMEEIGYDAFNGCTSLEKVFIPDTVTKVGAGAFAGCTNLKSVYLGKKLSQIGTGIFTECTSLNTLNIHRDNKSFSYEAGVIYDKEKTIAYCMLPGYAGGVYRMPLTVKEIKGYAFWGCQNLTKVEISGNVSDIADYAFANCENLEKAMIPYSVYRIGIGAFSNCDKLGETEIPASVAEIHTTAFEECPALTIIAPVGSKGEEYAQALTAGQAEAAAKTEAAPAAVTAGTTTAQAADNTADTAGTTQNTAAASDIAEKAPADNKTPGVEVPAVDVPSKGTGSLLGQTRVINGKATVIIDGNRSQVIGGGTN